MAPPNDISREQREHPRTFASYTFVYPVLSRRLGGVSIGINVNIDKNCNFDCPYCQVDRSILPKSIPADPPVIRKELESLLSQIDSTGVCRMERFANIEDQYKHLLDFALSGDGEPTLISNFAEVCQTLYEVQENSHLNFQLTLITNATLLNQKRVIEGLSWLCKQKGEVWAKLDAGTDEWYQKVNVSKVSLDQVEKNIILCAQQFPTKIQSLFCALHGEVPGENELKAYLQRLKNIHASGATILEVQLHTLARVPSANWCSAVDESFLTNLKERIEMETPLRAHIYGVYGS